MSRLTELKNVEKYELISKVYENRDNILSNWEQIFRKDYMNYSTEFNNLIAVKDYEKCIKLLDKVNAISELD